MTKYIAALLGLLFVLVASGCGEPSPSRVSGESLGWVGNVQFVEVDIDGEKYIATNHGICPKTKLQAEAETVSVAAVKVEPVAKAKVKYPKCPCGANTVRTGFDSECKCLDNECAGCGGCCCDLWDEVSARGDVDCQTGEKLP